MRLSQVNPAAYQVFKAVEDYVDQSGLDRALLELVRLRASYINGCAFCVDKHTQDAACAGETAQRLHAVPVWRETPFFSPRERAALAWTETITEISHAGVSDAAYADARATFEEADLVNLTLAIVAINGWNRLAIAFGSPPGTYQPTRAAARSA